MENSIFNLLIAPWKTAILQTAVRFKIFTVLADKTMTAENIAQKIKAKEYHLAAVLNALVGMGLLQLKNGEFGNTHTSRIYFVEQSPFYVGDFVELLMNERPKWDNLYSTVRQDVPEPDGPEAPHKSFIMGMHNLGNLGEVEALLKAVDFEDCKEMIDAGGGSGIYSAALCQKYPGLKSTILDCEETLAITREILVGCGNNERIRLRTCDIIEDKLGDNIDAVLLSDVVYDESEAVKILPNIWDCLREGGRLVVRGYYSDPDNFNSPFGALFTLNVLASNPNRKIMDFSTLKTIVKKTGFYITKACPLTERSSIITAYKTGN